MLSDIMEVILKVIQLIIIFFSFSTPEDQNIISFFWKLHIFNCFEERKKQKILFIKRFRFMDCYGILWRRFR